MARPIGKKNRSKVIKPHPDLSEKIMGERFIPLEKMLGIRLQDRQKTEMIARELERINFDPLKSFREMEEKNKRRRNGFII